MFRLLTLENRLRIRFTLVSEIADCPPLCYLDHTICPLRSASHSPLDESLASLLVERQLLGAKPHGRLEARGPSGRKATRAVGPSRSPSWRLGPGPGWCLDRTGAPRSRLRLSHRMMCEASGLAGDLCAAPDPANQSKPGRRSGPAGSGALGPAGFVSRANRMGRCSRVLCCQGCSLLFTHTHPPATSRVLLPE
jgi:hypothetical protein